MDDLTKVSCCSFFANALVSLQVMHRQEYIFRVFSLVLSLFPFSLFSSFGALRVVFPLQLGIRKFIFFSGFFRYLLLPASSCFRVSFM